MLTDTWVFHVAWAICEKCDSGQLGLWHFQHGVSCWTTGLLLRFLVSGRPHNLSKLHTPQWLRFRPAAIVKSCCRVESGSFMSTPHHGAVSMDAPACRIPSAGSGLDAGKGIQTVVLCLMFQMGFLETAHILNILGNYTSLCLSSVLLDFIIY